jgi:hypothetical protein
VSPRIRYLFDRPTFFHPASVSLAATRENLAIG